MTAAATIDTEDEIELFRDSARKFLEAEVLPSYDAWEKAGILPRSVWTALGEAGLLCVDVPEEYGGSGSEFRMSAIVVEEMSRLGFGALASNVSVHSDIVAPYIMHLGSEAQKKRWLPKMVTGEAVGAIAMTEPGAGSDLQGMKMKRRSHGRSLRARRREDVHHERPALRPRGHGGEDRPRARAARASRSSRWTARCRASARPEPREDRPPRGGHVGALPRGRDGASRARCSVASARASRT
jgi:hypothetical protein